jgi:hypothetical protein
VVPSSAPASAPVSAEQTPRQALGQAIDLYVVGRYQDAVDLLRPLVEGRVLEDTADHKEALRTYGISLVLVGSRPGAERAFRDLLRLDPTSRLDPSFVRPEVVVFFEEVRRLHLVELHQVERRGGRSAAKNLLPPWGQFQNGHRLKGYLLLGGELTFAVTSITTAALLWSWQDGETGQFHDKESAYGSVSMVNYVSFGLAAALVLYGIVDGLYYYYSLPPVRRKQGQGSADPNPWTTSGMHLLHF